MVEAKAKAKAEAAKLKAEVAIEAVYLSICGSEKGNGKKDLRFHITVRRSRRTMKTGRITKMRRTRKMRSNKF